MDSPKASASGDLARTQANLSQQLSEVALPEFKDVISQITGQLQGGRNGIMPMVQEQFAPAFAKVNQEYDTANVGAGALVRQRAKQSGEMFTNNQLDDATLMAAHNVETDRQAAMRRLNYAEASANLDEWNQLIQLLGGASGAALNLGQGASGNQARAIGMLSDMSPFGGAMSGAASGASLGGTVGGGWGALIGAIGGGAAGYFGAGG